jgi:7-cyano-7-deazaguanine synthase
MRSSELQIKPPPKKAVVLVSGGLDSATVLAMATSQGFACHALSFDYGQRHKAELVAAAALVQTLGAVEHKVIKLDLAGIGGSALTDASLAVPEHPPCRDAQVPPEAGCRKRPTQGIPVTYVPARNTVFLALALGWAEVLQAHDIFIGINAVDYSGYPDCRPEYIKAFQALANLATRAGVEGQQIMIRTPLLSLSKAQIIQEGARLGVDYSRTVSCYTADGQGRACGVCDACRLRVAGFQGAGLPDPTRYRPI